MARKTPTPKTRNTPAPVPTGDTPDPRVATRQNTRAPQDPTPTATPEQMAKVRERLEQNR